MQFSRWRNKVCTYICMYEWTKHFVNGLNPYRVLSRETERVRYTFVNSKTHRKRPSPLSMNGHDVLVRNPRDVPVCQTGRKLSVGIYGKNDDTPSMGAFENRSSSQYIYRLILVCTCARAHHWYVLPRLIKYLRKCDRRLYLSSRTLYL